MFQALCPMRRDRSPVVQPTKGCAATPSGVDHTMLPERPMSARKPSRICRSVGEAADLLKSIANPNRLSIVCMLLEGERSVAELEAELGIRQPTLSQQLCELREAGIVTTRRKAKHVIYRVADARAGRVIATLREIFADLEVWCGAFPRTPPREPSSAPPVDLMLYD
jgi:DNA-binding transcriptional ArsR family regulator